jgi:hypothetical protein
MKARFIALATLLIGVAGCDDVIGIGNHDFEGFYSFAGTVDDEIGDAVIGTFSITRQRGGRADVSIDWSYLDNGQEIIVITTDSPATADLDSDGDIFFEFEGELFIDGDWYAFRLTHDGRLRRGVMTGGWELSTGLPTTDSGTFTAQRH